MTAVAPSNTITLTGSATIVAEFFNYGINNILYQRGVYPTDSFTRIQKYGISLFVCNDTDISDFLIPLTKQITEFLQSKQLRKLVLIIASVQTKEVLERWEFNIKLDDQNSAENRKRDQKKVNQEIADVMRQITASVTFLPLLEEPCAFDILLYTIKSADAPEGWEETGPKLIANSEEVVLRSFSTTIHAVDSKVTYKSPDL